MHTDDDDGRPPRRRPALVRAGIARTRLTTPLEPIVVETVPRTLVIGGGIAGLRAAIGLADIGLRGVSSSASSRWAAGSAASARCSRTAATAAPDRGPRAEVRKRPTITVLTGAEVVAKSGSFGDYQVEIRVGGEGAGTIERVGSIIVATGFDSYQPEAGEFGYGIDGVVTLPEFKELVDGVERPLAWNGRPVRSVAYVYCVGSRTRRAATSTARASAAPPRSIPPSRWPGSTRRSASTTCTATCAPTASSSCSTPRRASRARSSSSSPATPRRRSAGRADGRLAVTVTDLLTEREELALPADLVVLVTGMVPRANEELVGVLKLPLGKDGFFNEIHPKLRPVETVVDGVLIAGACQGPKTSAESVASGLAAVTQSAAVSRRGSRSSTRWSPRSTPTRARPAAICLTACPYDAISMAEEGGRLAVISATGCKGCGGCVPMCPENAIDLRGYTDAQVTAMIDSLLEVAVVMAAADRDIREVIREEPVMRGRILEALAGRTRTPSPRSPRPSAPRPTRSSSGSWACAATAGSPRSRPHRGRLLPVRARDGRRGPHHAHGHCDLASTPTSSASAPTDISACFSCGTCTAICPLSESDATFPRRIIRYAQVGMKDQLLSSKELWPCYPCGECSDSCPTQAEPSDFMAAARRYAIASYDRTRLARTMYLHPVVGDLFALALAAFFAALHVRQPRPAEHRIAGHLRLHPRALIHDIGVVVMILVFAAGMPAWPAWPGESRSREGVGWGDLLGSRAVLARGRAAWSAIGRESLGQRRYRQECEADAARLPWYRRRWLIHAATMWGFLGCWARPSWTTAWTCRDQGDGHAGAHLVPGPPARHTRRPALVYGVTMLIVDRFRAANRSVAHSTTADWTLLVLLWVTGVTGFVLELALYLPRPRPGATGCSFSTSRWPWSSSCWPVHEARPRHLPAPRAVLRRPRGKGREHRLGAKEAKMTQTLPRGGPRAPRAAFPHVNRMPAVADAVLTATADVAARAWATLIAFLNGTLVPHIVAAEHTLYPELERMLQNLHSMAPMRREHAEVRRLVAGAAEAHRPEVDASRLTLGRTLALRRVMFHLYSLLKIHLAEEEAYMRIVEHGVDRRRGRHACGRDGAPGGRRPPDGCRSPGETLRGSAAAAPRGASMLRAHMNASSSSEDETEAPAGEATGATARDGDAADATPRALSIATDRDFARRADPPRLGAARWAPSLDGAVRHGPAGRGGRPRLRDRRRARPARCITNGSVDVGQVYRTLRDLEEAGQVRSSWTTGTGPGPPRLRAHRRRTTPRSTSGAR